MMTGTAMIVVTHLLGVGHLVRAAAIGRALAKQGWRVVLVSGGKPTSMAETSGCELIQLPPIYCETGDFRTIYREGGGGADESWMSRRKNELLAAFDEVRPDVLITELFPFGRRQIRAEFEALLDRAWSRTDRPAILCSIRDVLHSPSRRDKIDNVHRLLGRRYDAILLHGDDAVTPLSASWPTNKAVERRILATGYVRDAERARDAALGEREDVIVSAGGSSAGEKLLAAAVESARLTPDRRWRILAGHSLPDAEFAALRASAPDNAIVERARSDFPALLARAELSISQAGYNTVLDLAAAGLRAIVVPFAQGGEEEQTLRAAALQRLGLVDVIEESALSAETLAAKAQSAAGRAKPDWSVIKVDGASRTADLVAQQLTRAKQRVAGWSELKRTLDELRTRGLMVPIWIRDDDAVEMTGALRDFLQRLGRRRIPAALAVVPSRLSPSLETELSEVPDIELIVHGWAHANHAPAGARKSEYPAGRDEAAMTRELRDGWMRAVSLAPSRALPVFAPPWNRMTPQFAELLVAAGYRGYSSFGKAREPLAAGALRCVNTHWDPIAWRDGGGLRDESELLSLLSKLISQQLAGPRATLEPIGLLTHHLVHDDWIDRFLDQLFDVLQDSGAVKFLTASEVFGVARGR
ncbi:glycosyltransferase [Terrarubrum flagellatum]|uniref:glycosyltransferase n=1 Tax=Terrirubrum flagellatum TaxID=2895980 RepID=UPI0031450214